jgi:hypothetical protein
MPSTLSAAARPVLDTDRIFDDPDAALGTAARAWVENGETPEVVAVYAHALRQLIGDL